MTRAHRAERAMARCTRCYAPSHRTLATHEEKSGPNERAQHPSRRLRSRTRPTLVAVVGVVAVARTTARGRTRVHQSLHAQFAVLAVARVVVHRSLPAATSRA